MKRNISSLTPMLVAMGTLALLTCRNPLLSVGLGDKVDITPPGISLIDSDGVQNGAYVHGTITIKGKSTDDIGVQSVSWTVTDTKTSESSQPALAELDETRMNWSFQLNTAQPGTLFKDGEKSFVFTVTDGAGKTTETRMLLIFDNGAPVAMVNLPSSETDPLNATVRLSGEAYDPFGVQSVTVKLFNSSTSSTALNGASGAPADGTNTWNYSFDSTTLTAGAGDFWFQVTVQDRAGNSSAHQYLYSEVFAANSNKQVTVDKLSQLEAGESAAFQDLAASELPGLQKTRQKMAIDQNSDKPTFIISSPLPSDVVGFNSRVVGLVNDDDGVKNGASDIEVRVWKADNSVDFGWAPAAPSGSGLSVRFSYALSMISASGSYKLQVRAKDIYDAQSTSGDVIFTVDAGIPAVSVDAVARVYFNQNETLHLTGTAESVGGQVNKVELAIGATKVLASLGSPNAETTTWTGDFPLAGITEAPTPNKTLVVEATDSHLGTDKVGSTNLFLIIDNTSPQARFVSPSNGATVYNQVTLRGTSSDNSSLTKVQLRIGKAGTGSGDGFFDITGSLYDWTKDFLSNDYANSTQSTDRGDGTWSLPIYCRVYDIAGIVSTNEPSNPADPLYPGALAALYGSALSFNPANVPAFSLVIDLDRDKPTITIQTPRDGTNVAGTVVASGSCFDESPGMDKVEIQIAALRDDDSLIGYVTPIGAAEGAPGWIVVPWAGGQRSYWQQSLNENEKLYNVGAAGGAYPGEALHNGKLRVSVRPTDLGAKVGNAQTVTFRLDDTIPRLEAPKLTLNGADVAAVDYLYARGTIRLKAKARDNLQVTSIKISMNGGSSYGGEQIGGSYVTPAAPSDYFDIDYPIDTLTDPQIPAGIQAAKNGLLTLGVKVQDNAAPAPYVNTWFVTLNMDNLVPTVSYTGTSGNGHDPMLLSGDKISSSQIMGTSTDSGAVSGIDRVEVYLVRGADVLRLSDGNHLLAESGTFGDPPASAPYTTDAAYKAVIDWAKVGAVHDMQLFQNGPNVDWWVKLNTTAIPDGPVEIHYVAFDKAGNGTHGSQAGYIRNNAPVIGSITLGTDVNGDGIVGNVASGESKVFSSGYAATDFTVRNGKLTITVTASSGNGPKRYSIKYAGTTEKNVSPFTSSSVAITDFTGMPDGAVNGSTFTVLVYDSTVSDDIDPTGELTATVTLGMTFANSDATPPQAWMREFSTTKGDFTKTDYSVWEEVVSPENSTLQAGHIELMGDSLYDNGAYNPGDPSDTGAQMSDDDPDVSGKIVLRGVAWDNQRLGSVFIDIDTDGNGTFDAGESTQILQPGAGNLLVGVNGGLIKKSASGTDLQSFDLEKGHQVEYYWVWDTSAISAKARANVKARVRAIDASTKWSADKAYAYTTSPVAPSSSVSTVLKDVRYVIVSGGSTNFASLGAPDSLAGTAFMATRDGTGSDGTGTVYRESTMMYNLMTVDVVPYVRRLITPLSSAYTAKPSVFDRTALGRYPVAENATVHVYGFNFNGTSTAVAVNGTALAAPLVPDGMPTLHISVNTGATALSGALSLTVGGVPALNNTNNNARTSNQEPNGVNNDLLTDDRILDVWKFTNVETNAAVKYPMMRISPTQQVGFSYGDIESNFIIRVGGTKTIYEVSPSKYAYNAIAFDQATSPNFYALALDTDRTSDGFGGSPRTGTNSCTKMNFFSRQLGSGNGYPGSYQPGTYKRQLEANWNGYQYNSLRSMYPDMVATSPASPTDGNPTKIYMVYYDQILGQTKFRYGTVGADGNTMDYGLALNLDPTIATAIPKIGTAGGSNEGTAGSPLALAHSVYRTGSVTNGGSAYYAVEVEPSNTYTFVLDALSANADLYIYSDPGYTTPVTPVGSSTNGGTTTDFIDHLTAAGTTTLYIKVQGAAAANYRLSYNDRGTATNYHIVAGPQTAYKGGQYAGIGVTSAGVAVVAWYDKPNTRLMYSYNTDPSSSGGSSEPQWQANAVVLDSDFSGWFVDVAVDGGNAIHIAYYNSSNGDLRYIRIPSYNGAPSSAKTIDSFLSTGSNITIMTKLVGGDYVPYITYYMGALTATRNSLRMAYRINFTALNDGAGQYDNKYTGDWEITSIPTSNIPKDHTVSLGFKDLGAKPLQPIGGYATEVNLETAQLK